MLTKKDLEIQIQALEEALNESRELRDEACNSLYSLRKLHREQLDALAANNFPFDWYKADADYGTPICVAGSYSNDSGLSLEIYTDEIGNIIGGIASERTGSFERWGFGFVPAVVALRD